MRPLKEDVFCGPLRILLHGKRGIAKMKNNDKSAWMLAWRLMAGSVCAVGAELQSRY